jgi:two-component system, NtrC family, response regulator HydG
VAAFLQMITGVHAGARFDLDEKSESLIGRDWKCQIALNDPECSREHAMIYRDVEGWWIVDRGSSNGTFINGQTIDSARLVDGTEVRIGSNFFTFCQSEPIATTSSPPVVEATTSVTLIHNRSHDTNEFGQYTLEFLKGIHPGQDLYTLFRLTVKLLSASGPDEVIQICLTRLCERTGADVAGFLWVNDEGKLIPKMVFPEHGVEKLKLRDNLTQQVVEKKKYIHIQHDSVDGPGSFADAICVPLIPETPSGKSKKTQVLGAIHLYRQNEKFHENHPQLAQAMANILTSALIQAYSRARLEAEHTSLVQKTGAFDELLGDSPGIKDLTSKISRIAKASGCVLIRGESGVGKELVARALHRNSPRDERPMLTVNCAAIPRELMESQLFGHKKGAFTGADRDHIGWFQQADLGTLFLDEIGELTLDGQAKLLRILEGHPFMPVGSSEPISVDVRVICATNRDLREFVNEKRFREDLYYRLSVFELPIPPLRERGDDIQLLVNHFLKHFRERHGRFSLELSPKANATLLNYHWPGNIRQLRNVIDSAVVMADGNSIEAHDLGIREHIGIDRPEDLQFNRLENLRIEDWEKKLVAEALQRTSHSIPESAKLLGISRATLYRKLEEYKIERKPE